MGGAGWMGVLSSLERCNLAGGRGRRSRFNSGTNMTRPHVLPLMATYGVSSSCLPSHPSVLGQVSCAQCSSRVRNLNPLQELHAALLRAGFGGDGE